MKRYTFILAAVLTGLLAACAPGPQQSELEPAAPVIEPEPLPEVPAPTEPASEPSVVVVPAEPADAPEAVPEVPEVSGADETPVGEAEAAAPTSDPQGTISISADNQTFVTNVAGEVTPVTVTAGGTFYLRLEFTDPDGISAAQVELRNSADRGTLPRGPFTVASSDCEAAVAAAPTELSCTVAVAVAPDAQNIEQPGEVAYAFRPLVTDAAGNGDLAFSWAYLEVQPQ